MFVELGIHAYPRPAGYEYDSWFTTFIFKPQYNGSGNWDGIFICLPFWLIVGGVGSFVALMMVGVRKGINMKNSSL